MTPVTQPFEGIADTRALLWLLLCKELSIAGLRNWGTTPNPP
jgi:hypothetical protein